MAEGAVGRRGKDGAKRQSGSVHTMIYLSIPHPVFLLSSSSSHPSPPPPPPPPPLSLHCPTCLSFSEHFKSNLTTLSGCCICSLLSLPTFSFCSIARLRRFKRGTAAETFACLGLDSRYYSVQTCATAFARVCSLFRERKRERGKEDNAGGCNNRGAVVLRRALLQCFN